MALRLEAALAAMHRGGRVGLERAAEHLLRESRALCPIEEGFLRLSGKALVHSDSRASVSYGSGNSTEDYAVVQHEALDFYHDDGQAKYLEQPLRTEARTMKALIAEAVREHLR